MINQIDIKEFLDEKADLYEQKSFIESDPISIPHQFTTKEDIEIAAFMVASIAWGKRTIIINNGNRLMKMMDYQPHQFLIDSTDKDFEQFSSFVHRTFSSIATVYFLKSLRNIYLNHNGLEAIFKSGFQQHQNIAGTLEYFRTHFLALDENRDFAKSHVPNILKNSACKRLNMFLRWMVRDNGRGVDFGLWRDIPTSKLMIPLDLHSGGVSRKLGILTRRYDDWKAVDELTSVLRNYDSHDPIKYDYALFGLGVFEHFQQ